MKRFYKQVSTASAGDGWQVHLDGRGVKTVKGSPQIAPSKALAEALAQEWSEQGEEIDPTGFVFRDMTDYALDIVAADRPALIAKLLAYIETDTLCYRADPDEPLHARQQEVWEPLLSAFEQREGIKLVRVSGIVHRPQDQATHDRLRHKLEQRSDFALAGLENLASLSASLSIALMASEQEADVASLWDAASLEEDWQAELWGRDEEAQERRDHRRGEFAKAHRFIALADQA